MERHRELRKITGRLEHELPALLEKHAIPGMTIGICDSSGTRWAKAFGFTRAGGRDPITTDTMFSVQSISKMYTSTLVMLAVQRGLLSLDQPITAYLPKFTVRSIFESAPEQRITLRHLLNHSAGFTHEAPEGSNYRVGRASFAAHCRSIADTWLRFPVGHHHEYSNLGIDLAGCILQTVARLPFSELARRWLFEPLGMHRTSIDHRAIIRERDRAIGHSPGIKHMPVRIPMVAAGGVYTSILDACRFIQLHLAGGGPLLDPNCITQLYESALPDGQRVGYGLGVRMVPVDGHTARGHSGGGFGFLADSYWLPDVGIGVAVLTNSTSHPLQWTLASQILRDLAGPRAPDVASVEIEPPSPNVGISPDPFIGTYVASNGTLSIVSEEGRLALVTDNNRKALRLVAPDQAVVDEVPPRRFRLLRDAAEVPRYLQDMSDGTVWYRNDQLCDPLTDIPSQWAEFEGEYAIESFGKRAGVARLHHEGGCLLLDWPDMPRLRMDEHKGGVFFSCTGEALDLHCIPPTYANIRLRRLG